MGKPGHAGCCSVNHCIDSEELCLYVQVRRQTLAPPLKRKAVVAPTALKSVKARLN